MKTLAFLGLLFFCVPASAEQFAVATDAGDTLELHDVVHGKCPAGIREARYIYDAKKGAPPVDGCWKFFPEQNVIALIFEDGDTLVVKVEVFTWKRGRKPVST
jgi:hypothetical protein